jgi:hypothetical protein
MRLVNNLALAARGGSRRGTGARNPEATLVRNGGDPGCPNPLSTGGGYQALAQLDGTKTGVVSMLTGFDAAKLAKLGGIGE